ncbi:MAG: cupin domain-containing protein [Chthoniobacteraceae bacterium]
MKTILTALISLALTAFAQDPNGKDSEAKPSGEREGAAPVLHRDDVLHDRGGGKHLWPLLNTPEARMNYFEVTSRGPLHFHPDADHRLYVLEGEVLVTCGATTTKCAAGDFIIIPRGVRHCYDVVAPGEKALLLTFDAPPYDPKKTVNVEPKPVGK